MAVSHSVSHTRALSRMPWRRCKAAVAHCARARTSDAAPTLPCVMTTMSRRPPMSAATAGNEVSHIRRRGA
eukprot:scaffold2071_cov56-Phaeocystis_antarctica.AAC.11